MSLEKTLRLPSFPQSEVDIPSLYSESTLTPSQLAISQWTLGSWWMSELPTFPGDVSIPGFLEDVSR